MIASQLVNHSLPTLRPQDTVALAIDCMEEFRIGQLALVEHNVYQGIISENTLLDIPNDQLPLNGILSNYQQTYCFENQHILECVSLAQKHQLEVVPVLDEGLQYLGTIATTELYQTFISLMDTQELGAILVLSLQSRDYSLSEITRLIEQNDTKVISSYFNASGDNSSNGSLTLKLNKTSISGVVATLERYGYTITSVFANDFIQTPDRERLDMLLHYLNI